ncbi:hypothetical protein SRHO_G00095430 [Serrasalmus rhombeus]
MRRVEGTGASRWPIGAQSSCGTWPAPASARRATNADPWRKISSPTHALRDTASLCSIRGRETREAAEQGASTEGFVQNHSH